MTAQPLVSFVVIAYNEERNILRTLTSIMALEQLGAYEIIVVNDGSRDGTAGVIRDLAARNSRVRVIDLAENQGRGSARHLGISEAQAELIATVDADIVLPPDWFVRALAALGDHAAVGGTAVPDGDVAYLHKRFGLTPRFVGHTVAITGSNALYRRDVFDVVQFDSELREGEDSALNHSMIDNRLSCSTVPGLLVQHIEDKDLCTSLRWLFEVGRGATRQLLTYRRVRGPDMATGAFVAAAVAGLSAGLRGHRLAGVAIPACFVLTASAQHVKSRFETPPAHWPKTAAAVAVDSALLTAYFSGRLAGLTAARRRTEVRSEARRDSRP